MAGLNKISRKLQKALIQGGMMVKIGTSQFYTAEQNRMIDVYIVSIPVDFFSKSAGSWKKADYQLLRTASINDVVLCLVDLWNAQKEWTGTG